ncbi:hypothetical protein OPT61_g7825 [Boeremia exigua]|uniref:Uncharacterized protein n=1 Tax=Boeremia exigua TaxID=749465 RepID=A0ACC2I0P5_9PLEO|nr:hypothetical protein OPT61_g7825 [Boeremia exigua]
MQHPQRHQRLPYNSIAMGVAQHRARPEVRVEPAGEVSRGLYAEVVQSMAVALGAGDAEGDGVAGGCGWRCAGTALRRAGREAVCVAVAWPAGVRAFLTGGAALVAFYMSLAAWASARHDGAVQATWWIRAYRQVWHPLRVRGVLDRTCFFFGVSCGGSDIA